MERRAPASSPTTPSAALKFSQVMITTLHQARPHPPDAQLCADGRRGQSDDQQDAEKPDRHGGHHPPSRRMTGRLHTVYIGAEVHAEAPWETNARSESDRRAAETSARGTQSCSLRPGLSRPQ